MVRGSTNLAARSVQAKITEYCRKHREPRFANLSQPELHRLRRGERPSVREPTVYGLFFLPPDHADSVDAELFHRGVPHAIVSPEQRRLLVEGARRFKQRPLARSKGRQRILASMRAILPHAFARFEAFAQRREHSEEAIGLALDRVVEPFVLADQGGSFDRPWKELPLNEQRDYVHWALWRERVLLNRKPDLERAQMMGRNRLLVALAGGHHRRLRRRG